MTVDGATLHFKGSKDRYGVAVAVRPVTPDDNYLEVHVLDSKGLPSNAGIGVIDVQSLNPDP
ncbi:hypothetical protein T484DRAFT_1869854 [Baffinella frigidus]|nr:hypothetical protein T484DRAFT_1869854 [Cryptophyta sp. CCMP2293]